MKQPFFFKSKNSNFANVYKAASFKKTFQRIAFVLLFSFTASRAHATIYYLTTAGQSIASTAGNWNTSGVGGGGMSATNFSNSGDTFVISSTISATFPNNTTTTFEGTLQVDGTVTIGATGNNQNSTVIANGIIKFSVTGSSQMTVNGTINGNNTFTLGSSGILITANSAGIVGIDCSIVDGGDGATVTFPITANYEFNGGKQATLGLPATVKNLTFSGSGVKTMGGNTTVNGNLTINNGISLNTSNKSLSLNGDFINYGSITAGTSNIIILGTSDQNIAGFTTTGTVSMLKPAGTATFKGDVTGGLLSIYGNGGTLNLGAGLTHTFTGTLTMSNGTLNGGSSTLKLGGEIKGTGATFITGTGTVEYNGSSQTVFSTSYSNLILSGSGIKSLQTGTTTIAGNLILNGTVSATTVAGLSIGGQLIINNGTTFTVTGFPLTVAGNTIVGGNLTISSAIGNKLFSGLVTILSAGIWYNITFNSPVSFAGGITNNGNFHPGTGIHSFITNTQTLSGNFSISKITIAGIIVINKNSLTVANELTGTGTLTQTANATLNIGGTSTITTLNAAAPGNTVNYTGVGQTVKATIYNNLTTSGTGSKTIAAGTVVTVNGTLTTNGLLGIISDETNSGSLIIGPTGNSSGTVIYNRYLSSAVSPETYSRWYITSSPINETGFNTKSNADKIHVDGSVTPNLYDFATYSEPDNNWLYSYQSSSPNNLPGPLTPGQGYLISLKPNIDGIIQFSGSLNNGNVSKAVTASNNNGWNAVGNPYTSAIGITSSAISSENFLASNKNMLNPDFAAIYVWNETASYDETQQYYKVIGNAGYTSPVTGVPILQNVNNIQTCQGFLIKANTDGTVLFTKEMQVHDTSLCLKSSKLSWQGITLLALSHGQTRSTAVAFNDQMTTGLDVTYDAGLLASDVFQVYTHLVSGDNAVDFAIQCLPDQQYNQLAVPVGVDLPEGGDLVFKASGIILPDGHYPVLEDKELGIKTALKTETDCYLVTLQKNTTGTGRFYLSVKCVNTWDPEVVLKKKYSASLKNNRISINGAVNAGTKVQLYDIFGRKVGEYLLLNADHNEITLADLSQRVYLLRIDDRNYSQTLKLVAVNTNF